MSQNNTISVKAKNIVDNFINENRFYSKISNTDVMKHFIITLYAQLPNAKPELVAPFEDCIFHLNDYFTQEEIDVLIAEHSQVIRYCFDNSDSTYSVYDGYYIEHNDTIEEMICHDPLINPYKTPKNLIELSMRLSGKRKDNENVYLPYTEIADYALYNPNASYHVESIGKYTIGDKTTICKNRYVAYSEILLDSLGIKSDFVLIDDEFKINEDNMSTRPDYVFSFNPMFNQSNGNSFEYAESIWSTYNDMSSWNLAAFIGKSIGKVKTGGCLDFVFPCELFEAKSFWDIFLMVFESKITFNATFINLGKIYYAANSVNCFFLHIEKGKDNDGMIRFFDASSSEFHEHSNLKVDFLMGMLCKEECNSKYEQRIHFSQISSSNGRVANQYFVDKNLPKLSAGEKYIPVGELVEVIESVNYDSLLSDPSLNWKESVYGPIRGTYVQGERLSSDYLNCDINLKNDISSAFCIGKKIVKSPCLVIGTTATGTLTVGNIKIKDKYILVDEDVIAFKLKSDAITEDYLLRELTRDYCTMQVDMLSYMSGSETEKFFDIKNVVDVKIAVPSMEQQKCICMEERLSQTQASLHQAEKEKEKTAEEFKRDVHMKKHAIGQTLFNLGNWWDLLQKARKEGNGIVNDSQEVGKKRKTKVVDIYSNIQMTLEKLQMQVDSFWRADGLQVESMSLTTFVKEYVKEHQSPLFVYEYDSVSTLANNNVPKVAFSKQALTMVFDNIINNACSHGFENKASESNIIKIEVQMDNGLPYIVISNNGNPIHEKISPEDVFTYGRSSKSGQAHYGIGGYEVRNLMREFQGEAEFISTPQEDFPVSYKLSFKEVSNNV